MDSSTSQFEAYQEEFTLLMQQAKKDPSLLPQCHDAWKQLSLEARSVSDTSLKRELLDRVQVAKSQLFVLQQEHDRQSLQLQNGDSSVDANRMQLKNNEDTIQRQNETLERAQKTMAETEAIGLEVTNELGQNRAKLESTRGRVDELQSMTTRADSLLTSMSKPWWRKW